MAFLLNSDTSQGSVVTQLRCGEIISQGFVANLLVNLSVKEVWKSVNIWRSYGQYCSALFFWTHSVVSTKFNYQHTQTPYDFVNCQYNVFNVKYHCNNNDDNHQNNKREQKLTSMWANAQPDGRPAEHRWRPLFNAAKFGWRPLLDAVQ